MTKKRTNKIYRLALGLFSIVFLWTSNVLTAEADTYTEMMRQFPGVTVSEYGTGWTTDYGIREAERHPYGYSFSTGATSNVQTPGRGEHYYEDEATGVVPISRWTLMHVPAQCIHQSSWPDDIFYGFSFAEHNCGSSYSSGWFATCANCNEYFEFLVYARESTVRNITFMPATSAYAYMCPYCDNLEQGVPYTHMCNSFISKNYYQVQYISNFPADATRKAGWMGMTYHMVENATMYNGKPASDPQYGYTDTHLRLNSFIADGYVFKGWNTERDGSGTAYTDGQAMNLCPDENGAIIRLFAQWQKVSSTLEINANGGSYAGYTDPITKGYGSTWTFEASKVTPPNGYKVTFNHMGGSGTPSITSTMTYKGKSISTPTYGLLVGDVYTFLGSGTKDTLTLNYKQNSITLPSSTRSGYSFGGWYADSACTVPVGTTGTTYTPSGNVTLYAKWVGLVLTSVDDYTSNDGKGAVDLSWAQPDGTDKTYQIYQYSEVNTNHKIINSASDIGTTNSVNKSFTFTGAASTYTVPYSGYYRLTLDGAQGGNYSTFKGGLGGRTTATIYLKAGEVLTYNIGGQNGYNGGGTASAYGVGGGLSSVSSNLKGTLLIAGGGGGAGAQGNGYAGGDATSVITGNTGQSGMTGGGGGYQGGTAGEYVVHTHTDDCMHSDPLDYMWFYNKDGYEPEYLSAEAQAYYSKKESNAPDWMGEWYDWMNGLNVGDTHADGGSYSQQRHFLGTTGYNYEEANVDVGYVYDFDNGGIVHYDFIPTKGNTDVFISAVVSSGQINLLRKDFLDLDYTSLLVYDQNNNLIYQKKASDLQYIDAASDWTSSAADPDYWTYFYPNKNNDQYRGDISAVFDIQDGDNQGHPHVIWNETIPLPEGTTGIRVICRVKSVGAAYNTSAYIECIEFTGGADTYPICGYTEGQVLSSKGAYGGSNYVNSTYCQSYTSESGKRTGNGAFSIVSTSLGFNDATVLNDVVATDMAKPDAIAQDSITKTSLNKTNVRVSFEKPNDNGTKYYHYVKSYSAVTGAYSLTSNTTINTLTTGVVKYHYVYDTSSSTTVTTSHVSTEDKYIDVPVPAIGTTKYLHVAAVDKAGNISSTRHIPIKAAGQDDSIVFSPKPITEQVGITMGDGVATGADSRTFYVRSDGLCEIELTDKAYLTDDGSRAVAQVDTVRFNVCNPSYGLHEWNESIIPYATGTGTYTYGNADMQTNASAQDRMILSSVSAVRYGKDNVVAAPKYTIPSAYDGQTFLVYPKAYTTYKHKLYSSVDTADRNNYIKLICDGTPPAIGGLEAMEDLDVLNMTEAEVTFTLTAEDNGSGIMDFWICVDNQDNFITRTISDEEDGAKDGVITITVPKYIEGSMESLEFCGDFVVRAYATDRVGNQREVITSNTGFALVADVERILAPHDPIFKRGESGILKITTWGYVEKVEVVFPDDLVALNPDFNRIYDYTNDLSYEKQENHQFMIPLYAPYDQQYTIVVRAYKGDETLEDYPAISIIEVNGSVLDEIRTRLR